MLAVGQRPVDPGESGRPLAVTCAGRSRPRSTPPTRARTRRATARRARASRNAATPRIANGGDAAAKGAAEPRPSSACQTSVRGLSIDGCSAREPLGQTSTASTMRSLPRPRRRRGGRGLPDANHHTEPVRSTSGACKTASLSGVVESVGARGEQGDGHEVQTPEPPRSAPTASSRATRRVGAVARGSMPRRQRRRNRARRRAARRSRRAT